MCRGDHTCAILGEDDGTNIRREFTPEVTVIFFCGHPEVTGAIAPGLTHLLLVPLRFSSPRGCAPSPRSSSVRFGPNIYSRRKKIFGPNTAVPSSPRTREEAQSIESPVPLSSTLSPVNHTPQSFRIPSVDKMIFLMICSINFCLHAYASSRIRSSPKHVSLCRSETNKCHKKTEILSSTERSNSRFLVFSIFTAHIFGTLTL